MTSKRGYWFLAGPALLIAAGVVYLQANAQSPPVRQPLITEALVDVEAAALTINGYDFPATVPEVTLGMTELTVVSATESAVLAGLPELLPGTYLLAATWPEGTGAVFFLTLGAVGATGPPGPQGPQGGAGVFLSTASESSAIPAGTERSAADGAATYTSEDHGDGANTHFGARALESLTTGSDNVAIGRDALRWNEVGSGNIAIGYGAGSNSITGSNNVYIGNAGVSDDEGTIRIGSEGVHNRIHIAGEVVGGGFAPVYQP